MKSHIKKENGRGYVRWPWFLKNSRTTEEEESQ
jgi:hypothetical protein